MRRFIAAGSLLIPLILVGCGGEPQGDTGTAPTPAMAETPQEMAPPGQVGVGSAMPSFIATGLDGQRYLLSGSNEKVRLVNVWATWCGPCRYEIPTLIALQEAHRSDGLQVIGISIDSAQAADQVRSFVSSKGITYAIAHDPEGAIVDLLATPVIPTTALIDRSGRIVWYHKGIVRAGDPELLKALESVL